MKSVLCLYDLAAGEASELVAVDANVEAPNWTRDGNALIVNSGGRLFRIAIADPASMTEIATGFARALNNDHGLSPDGGRLAISDSTETGQSCIYVLPVTGGNPVRVTEKVPSWWHGWSPDGRNLAYTARRDGDFAICTCPAEGGPETVLITGGGHYDGPDYQPDGRHIWFNSDRGGSMDLWRMPAKGGAAERMTDDDRADWFPHPSPDGRHVVYLSYEPGTLGHPPDRPVQLRLMDLRDGSIRVLVRLRGGQGTINVPSWSPEGNRFAYVRYGGV